MIDPEAALARVEIADLVYRYAHAVAAGDAQGCAALFAAEASFTLKHAQGADAPAVLAEHRGGEALARFFQANLRPGVSFPLVHNLLIEVDGAQANGRCVMTGAGPDGSPQFLGVYYDTFRRDKAWRFASRTFTLHGQQAR